MIELLVVVSIIALLIAILLPSLNEARAVAKRVKCMSNQRQIHLACAMYLMENRQTFPAHRDFNYERNLPEELRRPGDDEDDFWAAALYRYAPDAELYHCPELTGERFDYGRKWAWAFDRNNLGYGYNAFFLGLHPYPAGFGVTGALSGWITNDAWTGMSQVRSPSQNILAADANPKANNGMGSSSMWWPQAGGPFYEGVNAARHVEQGVVVFNDGHAEGRTDPQINPPTSPGATGDDTNVQFWDPRQRTNPSF